MPTGQAPQKGKGASQSAAIANLNTGTATTAQIATAVNSILAALRKNGTIRNA